VKVVDSSIWIEHITRGPLAAVAAAELVDPRAVVVPTLVLLEVYKFVLRTAGEDAADQVLALMMCSPIESLDPTLAIKAAGLCVEHRLATADATIYAHAVDADLPLVTCDAHFAGLPGVEYHNKRTPL
jgi:predicted nucleic acid-binding protein